MLFCGILGGLINEGTERLTGTDTLNTGGFATEFTQEVKLGTADITKNHYFDLCEFRAMHRECTLNAFTVGNLTNGECFFLL